MKNKIAGLVVAICCTLAISSAKAQCPGVMVTNNLSCNMTVLVQFYTCSMQVCGVQNNVNVASGASIPINCNLCSGSSCDVSITILAINGVGIGPIPKALYGTTCPGVPIAMPTGCNPATATLCFDALNNEFIAQ
jgi:hypothetical protein